VPILLLTWFAMLEGTDAAGGCESRRGKTERCLSEKISILISAYGSTAERGLLLADALHIPFRALV
jgi:hypothetical protein